VCTFYNADFLIYSSMTSFYIPGLLMLLLYYKTFRAIIVRAERKNRTKRQQHIPRKTEGKESITITDNFTCEINVFYVCNVFHVCNRFNVFNVFDIFKIFDVSTVCRPGTSLRLLLAISENKNLLYFIYFI